MKTMKKIVCALMTLVLLLSSVPAVFADEAETIDQDAACSLTIWKFDYTNAKKDGVWDEDAFPSTGWQESYVENALVNTNRKGDTDGQNGNALGNGQTSKGYAIAGVEFTYLKVADIVTFQDQGTAQVLYGFHKTDAAKMRSWTVCRMKAKSSPSGNPVIWNGKHFAHLPAFWKCDIMEEKGVVHYVVFQGENALCNPE